MSLNARRDALERPFSDPHSESVELRANRGKEPRTLNDYLIWMEQRWLEERPAEMHDTSGAPFFGPPDRATTPERLKLGARLSTPAELTGGSLLGSPRLADPFRRLMENSPFETETAVYDGHQSLDRHYVRPLAAALALLSVSHPMTARTLLAVGFAGFDWRAVALRGHWDEELFMLFLEKAMHLLWVRYFEAPQQRLA